MKENSIWNAFFYMKKSDSFFLFGILSGLTFFSSTMLKYTNIKELPNFIILELLIITILIHPFVFGYSFVLLKSLSEQENNYSAPKFSIKESFVYFFKFIIAIFLLLVIIAVPSGLLVYFLKQIGLLILLIFLIYCLPAMLWVFAHTKKLTTFINFSNILSIIKDNKDSYINAIAAYCILFIAMFGLTAAICAPFISQNANRLELNNLFPIIGLSMLNGYCSLVMAFINAKCINKQNSQQDQQNK